MRFIIGIVAGVALTVGAAYVHDLRVVEASRAPQSESAVREGQIVNWDVLGAFARKKVAAARRTFNGMVAP